MKQRVHEFTIKVRFTEPVSRADARAAVKDTIHGDFYPYIPEQEMAYYKVSTIK